MGTLGQHLQSAREARNIDIRDAAQQTRININYLKALEEEDFSKLPGEVFIKGFLKNYARFLNLDESDILRRYAELKPAAPAPSEIVGDGTEKKTASPETEDASKKETPIEPFVWGALILIPLLVFVFSSLPGKQPKKNMPPDMAGLPVPSGLPLETAQSSTMRPDKLYLEVVALQDTWLLVRTDTSPQKKAVLKKGESLIWSADERFLISYNRIEDVKLLLNGEELTVRGSAQMPIRDLAITRAGILNQPIPAKQPLPPRPKPKQAVQSQPSGQPSARPQATHSVSPPASTPQPTPASVPIPAAPAPAPAPAAAPASAPAPAPAPAVLPGQTQ